MIEFDNAKGQIINIGTDAEFIAIDLLFETIVELLNYKLKQIYNKVFPQ